MEKSDRDISQWDARLKQQLERSFHNYHVRRIDLSVARDHKKLNWTGETLIVERASSSSASATVRLMFEDADELVLEENVEINSIFNRLYLTNDAQADEWLDVIAGINFEYKKKIAESVYVDRGDVLTADFTAGTIPNGMSDLDLSGIVPANVKLVIVCGEIYTTAGVGTLMLMTKGFLGGLNWAALVAYTNGVSYFKQMHVVPDSNGLLGCFKESGATYQTLNLTIKGWFT